MPIGKRYQKRENEVDRILADYKGTGYPVEFAHVISRTEWQRWKARNFAREVLNGRK